MIAASALIGVDRLGAWLRAKGFTPRGRYEGSDRMGGQGRMADWVEASCLLSRDGYLSKTSVIDHLIDSGMVSGDDDAEMVADAAFAEMQRRMELIEPHPLWGFPFHLRPNLVERLCDWSECSEYLFLLLLSMAQLEPWLITDGSSYDEAGHLFERVVSESVKGAWGGPVEVLQVAATGTRLRDRVATCLAPFARRVHSVIASAPRRIKDGGLDVLARLAFPDSRPGGAHVLIQCGVGGGWTEKLSTPVLAKWRHWVNWRGPIYRAFALPLFLTDSQAMEEASLDGEWSLIFDRARLLNALSEAGSLPVPLEREVWAWCRDRVDALDKRGHLAA